jgi:Vanadium chloroperoxidase N-terminal domain
MFFQRAPLAVSIPNQATKEKFIVDHILYWNGVALEANRRDFSNEPGTEKPKPEQGGPTLSSRALAIVHLAMYDAHAGVVNNVALPRYLVGPPNPPPGSSASAAVATAAHTCLTVLYPRQRPHFDAALEAAGLSGAGVSAGQEFGLLVAKAILNDRSGDPSPAAVGYVPSLARGHHRPDPGNPTQGFHAPFYGAKSKCFAVTARHDLASPSTLGAADLLRSIQQVRGKGIAPGLMGTLPAASAKRSVDESLVAVYWAYDGVRDIGTPPRLYNQIVREIAIQKGNSVDDNARLFALVNVALGDAGILAWDQKFIHDFWRPVVGIREHDNSMGPSAPVPGSGINTECDPDWLPLGAPASNSKDKNFTPNFPAYPSGHATFGAAALHMVRLFYGIPAGHRAVDTVFTGNFVSDECNGITTDNAGTVRTRHVRSFPGGLWQMIEENGFSRVWLGVHWSLDAFALKANGKPDLNKNIGGVPLGLKIAEDIYASGGGKAPVKSSVPPRP